jgi:hypothetical protein
MNMTASHSGCRNNQRATLSPQLVACRHVLLPLLPQATGRKKLLVAGIVTDVCVLFPTLSALAEGYEVYVVVDASGTFNPVVRDAALTRASDAGAVLINWFAVACELQKDWRLGPNSGQVGDAVFGIWDLRLLGCTTEMHTNVQM